LSQLEDFLTEIFFSLPFPAGKKSKIFQIFSSLPLLSGSAVSPKNVIVVDVFYRA
jgi:hypothetical protein